MIDKRTRLFKARSMLPQQRENTVQQKQNKTKTHGLDETVDDVDRTGLVNLITLLFQLALHYSRIYSSLSKELTMSTLLSHLAYMQNCKIRITLNLVGKCASKRVRASKFSRPGKQTSETTETSNRYRLKVTQSNTNRRWVNY